MVEKDLHGQGQLPGGSNLALGTLPEIPGLELLFAVRKSLTSRIPP